MAAAPDFYLNLGSNIDPQQHLRDAVHLLRHYGDVGTISSVWESQAVGSEGPNFLNVSVQFATDLSRADLKRKVIDPIEKALGRNRTSDKNAPRTIDIDILLVADRPVNLRLWEHAYVILPLAELLPDYPHPFTGRRLMDEAPFAAKALWIRRRSDVNLTDDSAQASEP